MRNDVKMPDLKTRSGGGHQTRNIQQKTPHFFLPSLYNYIYRLLHVTPSIFACVIRGIWSIKTYNACLHIFVHDR